MNIRFSMPCSNWHIQISHLVNIRRFKIQFTTKPNNTAIVRLPPCEIKNYGRHFCLLVLYVRFILIQTYTIILRGKTMSQELMILLATAASIGFFHTILGPDHYLPFVVMSKTAKWSLTKTSFVTIACGIGHVLSSVVIGLIGIAFGIAVTNLENVESMRGNYATWALIAFGLVYFVWGVRRAWRNQPHQHLHVHEKGITHVHTHTHTSEHMHVHQDAEAKSLTPWVLFVIFVLGPCEPLIPLLMYPAAKNSFSGMLLVAAVFGIVTTMTMLGIVLISVWGLNLRNFSKWDRYSHALAGASLALCGVAIQYLGL